MTTTVETPLRAAIYVRISLDRDGEEKGITRQREDGHKLIANRGYVLAEGCEFEDNDISAAKGDERPGYLALMKAAQRGRFDVIVVFQMSRLWRNRRERAEGIELLKKAGVSVAVCKGQDLDLSTAYGRGVAGMLGEFDTMESEVKGERVAREKLQALQNGRHLGGPRPFGWQVVPDPARKGTKDEHRAVLPEVDDREAAIIRELAAAVLDDGRSCWALAKELNERGVMTVRGSRWEVTSVRNLLLRERNYGRVTISDKRGEVLAEGTWPAIASGGWVFDEAMHRRLVTVLRDPARRQPHGGNRVKYLLSGIAVCGKCQAELERPLVDAVRMGSGTASSKGADGRRYYRTVYRCSAKEHLFRSVEVADKAVTGRVFAILAAMTPAARLALVRGRDIDPELSDQAARLRRQLDELLDMWQEGEITRAQHRDRSARIKRELTRLEKAMSADTGSPALADLASADDVPKVWADMPLDRRRAAVAELVTVTVLPGHSGSKASLLGEEVTPEQAGLDVTYNGDPADLSIFGHGPLSDVG